MVRLIKEGYESWKETPFTLFYDGERHTLSKYTKDQFSDHPKMVIPQYNRETDTLYYIGIIDGENVGEKFINSSEAMEYLENYYTYGYAYDESIKRNKRRMKEGLPVYLKGDNDDKSRFLSRFISDVKYWISLGKTPEADKFLWAGTPEEQAQVIQDTFDAITDQADRVLTQDDIDYYVGQLLNRYDESVKRGSRKRRNKRC